MLKRILHHPGAMVTIVSIGIIALIGIFAPVIAPNDPYAADLMS